ncbi:hypothetical protein AB0E27_15135 [Streptomyces sparsogenes]
MDEAERAEAIRVSEINELYAELTKADQASNELRGENGVGHRGTQAETAH